VAVLFAVLSSGYLFSFSGILLMLPMSAVIVVLLSHAQDEYFESALYKQLNLA
jgi:predicted PurR-regulated permease PerM